MILLISKLVHKIFYLLTIFSIYCKFYKNSTGADNETLCYRRTKKPSGYGT